jgi:hypothetical protein
MAGATSFHLEMSPLIATPHRSVSLLIARELLPATATRAPAAAFRLARIPAALRAGCGIAPDSTAM